MSILGLREKKSGLNATDGTVGKDARAKTRANKAVSLEYQTVRWERAKMGESRFLARKKGDQSGSMERRGKGGLHSEGRRFQGGNGGQATRASLGDVEGSMSG